MRRFNANTILIAGLVSCTLAAALLLRSVSRSQSEAEPHTNGASERRLDGELRSVEGERPPAAEAETAAKTSTESDEAGRTPSSESLAHLRFWIIDAEGTPLPRVVGDWWAYEEASGAPRRSIRATSAADGSLTLRVAIDEGGVVLFRSDGFAPAERHVFAGTTEPVVVMLEKSEVRRRLWFLEYGSDAPVENARVSAGERLVAETDADGSALLPSWVASDELLVAEAPSMCTNRFWLEGLTGDVVWLLPACDVTFRFERTSGENVGTVHLWCRAPGLKYVVPPDVVVVAGGEAVVRLPRDFAVDCFAYDDVGRSAEVRLHPTEPTERCRMTLGAGETLVVTVQDADGAPVPAARARVQYRENVDTSIDLDAGVLVVSNANHARWIQIGAPGHSSVGLSLSSSDVRRDGSVAVTLVPAVKDARVHVVDSSGAGIPGLIVSLDSRHHVASDHPELGPGREPSGHAGWNVVRAGWLRAQTDADGFVSVDELAAGTYDVKVGIPGAQRIAGRLFQPMLARCELRSDTTVTIETARPIEVDVEAFDAETGLPVRELVVGVRRYEVESVAVSGNRWHGWVASDERELVVVAPNVGWTRVRLDGTEPVVRRSVQIQRGEPTPIRIEGDAAERVAGLRVRARLFVIDEHGHYSIGWRPVDLDERSIGALIVAADPPLSVQLEGVDVDGGMIDFEPQMQPWTPGQALTFQAESD